MKIRNSLTRAQLDKIFQLRPSYYCCPFCGHKIYVYDYVTVGELLNNQKLNLECCNCRSRHRSVKLYYFGFNYSNTYVITPEYVLPNSLIMHQSPIDYTRSFITDNYMQVSLYLDFLNENIYSEIRDYCFTIGWDQESAFELQQISNSPLTEFDKSILQELEEKMKLIESLDAANKELEDKDKDKNKDKNKVVKQPRRRIRN